MISLLLLFSSREIKFELKSEFKSVVSRLFVILIWSCMVVADQDAILLTSIEINKVVAKIICVCNLKFIHEQFIELTKFFILNNTLFNSI